MLSQWMYFWSWGGSPTTMPAATGSYTLTGVNVAFITTMPATVASYALAGIAAALTPSLVTATGSYADSGIDAAFNVAMAEATSACTVAWQTFSDNESLAAGKGAFTLAGLDAYLSHDFALGVPGGPIVTHHAGDERRSGTPFTKRRYREMVDAAFAEIEAERQARDREAERTLELARAADANARTAVRARWAIEDALSVARAHAAAVSGAQETLARARNIAVTHDRATHLRIVAAQAQRDQDDEEEALALLLLS